MNKRSKTVLAMLIIVTVILIGLVIFFSTMPKGIAIISQN